LGRKDEPERRVVPAFIEGKAGLNRDFAQPLAMEPRLLGQAMHGMQAPPFHLFTRQDLSRVNGQSVEDLLAQQFPGRSMIDHWRRVGQPVIEAPVNRPRPGFPRRGVQKPGNSIQGIAESSYALDLYGVPVGDLPALDKNGSASRTEHQEGSIPSIRWRTRLVSTALAFTGSYEKPG
jgi:hypothetical protein